MARKLEGNPKFYIDYLSYMQGIGNITHVGNVTNVAPDGDYDDNLPGIEAGEGGGYNPSLIGLNIQDFTKDEFYMNDTEVGDDSDDSIAAGNGHTRFTFRFDKKFQLPKTSADSANNGFFYGILGHSLCSSQASIRSISFRDSLTPVYEVYSGGDNNSTGSQAIWNEIMNFPIDPIANPIYDGWSMAQFAFDSDYAWKAIDFVLSHDSDPSTEIYLSSFVFGQVFQMPHSPDLNIVQEVIYDGIDRKQTHSGYDITNVKNVGSPQWPAGVEPFGLTKREDNSLPFDGYDVREVIDNGGRIHPYKNLGRRVWTVNFSYISSNDIFPLNSMYHTHWAGPGFTSNDTATATGYNEEDSGEISWDENDDGIPGPQLKSGIDESYSLIGTLLEKTMGGALPFIFQPNGDNYAPDQFYKCVLDINEIVFNQMAQDVYNVTLKIREVW